jgi:hypothetical protein
MRYKDGQLPNKTPETWFEGNKTFSIVTRGAVGGINSCRTSEISGGTARLYRRHLHLLFNKNQAA